eukprot:scaffold86675_cov39-Phaeocystis_antarctica.AAC.1
MHPGLQPYASRPATLCIPACNPMHPGLQPYVGAAAALRGAAVDHDGLRGGAAQGALTNLALTLNPDP